jgi:signal peptidase II
MENYKHSLWKNFTFILVVGFAFFVVEFFIKNLMIIRGGSNPISLGQMARLDFVANPNLAFSLPVNQAIIVVLALLIIMGLIQYFTVCCRDGLYANVWALNAIIWGAFSNVYDRVTRGFVVDYVHIGTLPVFNLSDVAIIAGFITLLYFISQYEKAQEYTLQEA